MEQCQERGVRRSGHPGHPRAEVWWEKAGPVRAGRSSWRRFDRAGAAVTRTGRSARARRSRRPLGGQRHLEELADAEPDEVRLAPDQPQSVTAPGASLDMGTSEQAKISAEPPDGFAAHVLGRSATGTWAGSTPKRGQQRQGTWLLYQCQRRRQFTTVVRGSRRGSYQRYRAPSIRNRTRSIRSAAPALTCPGLTWAIPVTAPPGALPRQFRRSRYSG